LATYRKYEKSLKLLMETAAEQPDNLSVTKRALLALKQMQAKLETLERDALRQGERQRNEPIAIIGMGCRFPGADDIEAFWRLLQEGKDAIAEVPPERWAISAYYDANPDTPGKICNCYGGFVPDLQTFDAPFFRIAPREALSLDPQQRLLLEVSWEALENAGLAADRLIGTQSGVFVGICGTDYWHRLLSRNTTDIDAYLTTGNTHSMASGRLAYVFGFNGPSISIDTACSSSLVAVHLACRSLRDRECNLALAGGVNRIISPQASINFSKAKMLSPDGRCKTFDATANGFVRSEGCGIVVLKRLSDALAAGDNVLAVIRGSAVNQDGRSSGLTVPHGPSQQVVIQQALENSRLQPREIDYLETHGTGTALGDPIEINAIEAVFGQSRPANEPLIVGSVKTNIGHLEAAAGIASLIKVVLALQNESIPANLHFKTPNPHINWQAMPIAVPTGEVPWLRGEKVRMAGVSSFGFSGTNAHAILAEAEGSSKRHNATDRPLHLLTLSARNEKALQALARRYCEYLKSHLDLDLGDVCFSANTGRSLFEYRLGVIAASTTELAQKLERYLTQPTDTEVRSQRVSTSTPSKIVFFFPDEILTEEPIKSELYQTQPTFRAAVDRCTEQMAAYFQITPQFNTFAYQYALYQLWQSWGIEPNAIAGAGVGEFVAACVTGVLTLEDSLKLVAAGDDLLVVSRTISYKEPKIAIAIDDKIDNALSDRWRSISSKSTYILSLSNSQDICNLNLSCTRLDWRKILTDLLALCYLGRKIDWSAFDRDYSRQKIILPNYPFQRQRYWIETT
jgi:acyl transferase domain-containing protein